MIHLTRSYDREGSVLKFKDRVTRQRVTLDDGEITKLGDDEYKELLAHLRDQQRDHQEDE